MDHFKLSEYRIEEAGSNHVIVLATGNRLYKTVLSRAFSNYFLSRTFDDRFMRFEWGTYVYNVNADVRKEIKALLELCARHVFLDDDLTECFALDYHTESNDYGGYQRSPVGSLVYQAKPYHRKPTKKNIAAAEELARQMISFIQDHPTYRHSDVILAAPPSRLDKPFDLPNQLAQHILNKYDTMIDGRSWIKKARPTRPMKTCRTITEKINNLRNAFVITEEANLENKTVLVVDDIYQSGFTLNEVSRVLFEAGAKSVIGLVASKTGLDM
jgi:competence protein ComFC